MPTIEQLKAALGDDPSDPVLHFSLANAYRDQNKIAEAIEHYGLATQHKRDYSAAWFEMARLAEAHADLKTARAAYLGAMDASRGTGDDHILKAAEVRLKRLERNHT